MDGEDALEESQDFYMMGFLNKYYNRSLKLDWRRNKGSVETGSS